ncbi:MAG: DUF2322 family protein [Ottowia sp.]|uniref:DUF2322 family protein n=1 Tax=Ottowia sp. TaxID=1898956 RepID=UPI001E154A48|nr:DUF2322 family protein [Ottowia sp.]MCP5258362.1 DUF2322 family protein [Burkholderiaceae bacterium]MCB2024020.1 DUF2322 family protein [Ottowia sp.]MCB2032000.1 DUF2322 family protein [Ottowia sp.]MCB2037369.1 DUF2322 family protein [Ottowia sp.]MCB2068636.1 DUF2322 family protein [Ottowia sp.]
MSFQDNLATLPAIDHLAGLDIVDAGGHVVHHIPAAPGKLGSLRVFNALAAQFDGSLNAAAVAQGLAWFAEHTADARARPGAHPNIDILLAQEAANSGWRLVPRPA